MTWSALIADIIAILAACILCVWPVPQSVFPPTVWGLRWCNFLYPQTIPRPNGSKLVLPLFDLCFPFWVLEAGMARLRKARREPQGGQNEEHGQTRARAREGQKGAPGRSKWGAFEVILEKNQKHPKKQKFSRFFFIFHFSFFFIFFSFFHFFQCSLQAVITSSFFSFPIVWWVMFGGFGGKCHAYVHIRNINAKIIMHAAELG